MSQRQSRYPTGDRLPLLWTAVHRRSAGALLTTAALVAGWTGALSTAAWASGTVTAVSPATTNNSGDTAVVVTGSGFSPGLGGTGDTALFKLSVDSGYGPPSQFPGYTLRQQMTDTTMPDSQNGTLPTSNAAPGSYDVYPSAGGATGVCLACFRIASSGIPTVDSVQPGATTGAARGPRAVDLHGSHLADGSFVTVLRADGVSPDPGLAFHVGDPNGPGYAGPNVLRGNVILTDQPFTPGKHLIQARNTIGETGAGAEYWQPYFSAAGVTPATVGAGVQNVTLTVAGQGIRQGSALQVSNDKCTGATADTCSGTDVTVGTATVSADGSSISAPVTFTSDARTDLRRTVTVTGPDGGSYAQPDVLAVTPAPSISTLSPATVGQGARRIIQVNGSNFATSGGGPVFTVGGSGVSSQTLANTNISAQVLLTVASDAATTGRSITVTNPDRGSSTSSSNGALVGSSAPLTIAAGPKMAALTPASVTPGRSRTVTVTGSGFDTSNGVSVVIGPPQPSAEAPAPDPALTVSNVTVSAAEKVTFTVTAAPDAHTGPRDVTVTNNGDDGTARCFGCLGLDALSASPETAVNSGPATIAFAGLGLSDGSTVRLVLAGDPAAGQPDLAGSNPTLSADGSVLRATFDLASAATGSYTALVTGPSGQQLSCTGCVTVTSDAISVTGVSPVSSGAGATDRDVTVSGSNISHGMTVTIANTSDPTKTLAVHDLQFVSPSRLTAKIDVPAGSPTGDYTATIATHDASQRASTGYTVNPPPHPTALSPASYGQGADAVHITITGPDLITGNTADTSSHIDLGPGITVTRLTVTQGSPIPLLAPDPDDTLDALISIAPNADPAPRDVTITNPDGGKGLLSHAFSVKPGPKITNVAPHYLSPDARDVPLTITGTDFSTTSDQTAVPSIEGVTLTHVEVTSNRISATATVEPDTGTGPQDVVVTNPPDAGEGTCRGCLLIATGPDPVTGLHVTGTSTSAIALAWTRPSDDGGAPISSYALTATDAAGHPASTAAINADRTAGTLSGLRSGQRYTLTVTARNVVGASNPSRITGQTSRPPASLLTSSRRPQRTTAGQPVTLAGRLTQVRDGSGIGGAIVEIALAPDVGPAAFGKVRTTAAGYWSYTLRPTYTLTVRTLYRGTATHAASQAPTYRHGVATGVTVTAPASGAVSSATTPLRVQGTTSPNKTGGTMTLYRFDGTRYVALNRALVSRNGTFTLTAALRRGDYTLKVGIGQTTGNIAGYCAAFRVHRR